MSKTLKKVTGVKRAAAQMAATTLPTAIASATPKKAKKPKEVDEQPVGVLAQVVQTEMVSGADLSRLRDKLLDQTESGAARAKYEKFVQDLDFAQQPSNFGIVTFGDVLHVTPAIKSNKRKLLDLYRVDNAVAQVYTDALSSYKALQDKAEALKIADYARQKKLEQKQLKAQQKPAKPKEAEAEKEPVPAVAGAADAPQLAADGESPSAANSVTDGAPGAAAERAPSS